MLTTWEPKLHRIWFGIVNFFDANAQLWVIRATTRQFITDAVEVRMDDLFGVEKYDSLPLEKLLHQHLKVTVIGERITTINGTKKRIYAFKVLRWNLSSKSLNS